MRDVRNSIVVIGLVFVSVLMLIASLEYTSNIVNAGSEPVDYSTGSGKGPDNDPVTSSSAQSGTKEAETGTGIDIAQLLGVGDEARFDPFAAGQDPGPILGVIVFLATLLAGTSAIVYWFRRKRRQKAPAITADGGAVAPETLPVPPASFEGRYGLRFPQIREPLPPTWGTDESLEMVITCNGDANRNVALSVDGGEARPIRLDGGKSRVMFRLPKGRHRITVSPGDGAMPGEASWIDVQIVDYREEIVRMFNDLCQRLKSVNADLGDEMTPREIERTVRSRMPETGEMMGVSVAVFEIANYSTHAVRRTEYERMYLSGMGLR